MLIWAKNGVFWWFIGKNHIFILRKDKFYESMVYKNSK